MSRTGFWGGLKVLSGYFKTYLRSFFVGSGDVLFITSGVGDSAHYRAYNPVEELRLHGFKAAVTISDNPNLPKLADKFKVFIFHRTFCNEKVKKLIRKIKEQKKEIIFDTDDLVYDPKYLVQMDYFRKMSKVEQALYKNGIGAEIINDPYVKTCTAAVSYLAEELRKIGKETIIVPNKISIQEMELADEILKKEKKDDGFVRIGYFSGTLSHNKDFATITDALVQIMERYPRVKLYLAGPLDIESKLEKYKNRIETMPFVSRDKYYKNIYEADINLAPLEIGNQFCESKSEIKFIEAGILKIPTVAVRNRTYIEAIADGEDGFLADNPNEWVQKIGRLVENKKLRRDMGEKARIKVLEKYSVKNSRNGKYYEYIKNKLND